MVVDVVATRDEIIRIQMSMEKNASPEWFRGFDKMALTYFTAWAIKKCLQTFVPIHAFNRLNVALESRQQRRAEQKQR